MANPPILIADTGPDDAPSAYQVPAAQAMRLQAVSAEFDGSGAGGDFLACLSVYAQSGQLLSRTFPGETIPAGDEVEVTYLPF